MNLAKSQIKIAYAQSMHDRFDKLLAGAAAECQRLEGAKGALEQCATKIEAICAVYDEQRESGEITSEQLAMVKKALIRAADCARSLRDTAATSMVLKQGEHFGLRKTVAEMRKEYESEAERVKAVLDAMESGDVAIDEGSPTVRVVPPDRKRAAEDIQQRREKARAEKLAKANGTPKAKAKRKARKKRTKATKKAD